MIHPLIPKSVSRFRPLAIAAVPAVVLALACSSCDTAPPKPAPPPITDTRPVGEGLKVIGFAMLGAAVVAVLGRLMR
jgi:hypothetical protein